MPRHPNGSFLHHFICFGVGQTGAERKTPDQSAVNSEEFLPRRKVITFLQQIQQAGTRLNRRRIVVSRVHDLRQ